jgi:hypothetical protein
MNLKPWFFAICLVSPALADDADCKAKLDEMQKRLEAVEKVLDIHPDQKNTPVAQTGASIVVRDGSIMPAGDVLLEPSNPKKE